MTKTKKIIEASNVVVVVVVVVVVNVPFSVENQNYY